MYKILGSSECSFRNVIGLMYILFFNYFSALEYELLFLFSLLHYWRNSLILRQDRTSEKLPLKSLQKGTHVNPWLFHSNVWQNSLQIKKKKRVYRRQRRSRGQCQEKGMGSCTKDGSFDTEPAVSLLLLDFYFHIYFILSDFY